LYQLIRSRKLATVQIGRRRLIPRVALQALIERLRDQETL
jgi:excisionase family DNA binding protein